MGVFRTPDDLASQVAAAVSAQGLTQHIVNRVLSETSVASADMDAFAKGMAPISDSTLPRRLLTRDAPEQPDHWCSE